MNSIPPISSSSIPSYEQLDQPADIGLNVLPPQQTVLPAQQTPFPFPRQQTLFPRQHNVLSRQETIFPLQEMVSREDLDHESGDPENSCIYSLVIGISFISLVIGSIMTVRSRLGG
jgi:hypothetical protein